MNRKGFMQEIAVVFIFVFLLGVAFTMIYFTNNTINTAWQNVTGISEQSKTMMSNYNDRIVNIMDGIFLFLVIAFIIILVLTAFALKSHPVFAMIGLLVLIVLSVLTFNFANTYNSVATSSALVDTANDFVVIPFILNNFPTVYIIMGFVFLIVLFAKTNQGINL